MGCPLCFASTSQRTNEQIVTTYRPCSALEALKWMHTSLEHTLAAPRGGTAIIIGRAVSGSLYVFSWLVIIHHTDPFVPASRLFYSGYTCAALCFTSRNARSGCQVGYRRAVAIFLECAEGPLCQSRIRPTWRHLTEDLGTMKRRFSLRSNLALEARFSSPGCFKHRNRRFVLAPASFIGQIRSTTSEKV